MSTKYQSELAVIRDQSHRDANGTLMFFLLDIWCMVPLLLLPIMLPIAGARSGVIVFTLAAITLSSMARRRGTTLGGLVRRVRFRLANKKISCNPPRILSIN